MQHKQTATGLAALGRGPDTELIHMTKGEIAGLQSLAQQHGGSLTINPHTGLPEAGFLSSILPMVIGAGITAATGGAAAPWMVGLGMGGVTALATGSLQKGLMAGLGAYGGASLAGSLGAAGAEGALTAGAGAAPTTAAGANMAAVQGVGTSAATTSAQQAATQALGGNVGMYPMTSAAAPSFAAGQTAAASPFAGIGTVTQAPVIAAAPTFAAQAPVAATPTFANMRAGLGNVTGSSEAFGKFLGENKMPLGAMGISALSGMEPEGLNAPEVNQGMIRPYTFTRTQKTPTDALGSLYTPGQSTRERNWFEDSYTAGTPYKAPGPEYMAGGGPVEAMSNANAIGANTGYPQADIHTGAYSSPTQMPISRNMITGPQDAAVDPYTGEPQFADGGEVSDGIIGSLLAQQKEERPQYENGSVGGYNYDQATGAFSRSPEVQRPQMPQMAQMPQDFLQGMYQNEDGMGGMLAQQVAQQPDQRPRYANNSVGGYEYNQGTGQFTQLPAMAAGGGISTLGGNSNLGGYSDGGQLLRGPGDGTSDDIPAMIGQKQPAYLADGEFVVSADVVGGLGNGSTEAGSRQLYAMMDRVRKARTGTKKMGKTIDARKVLQA